MEKKEVRKPIGILMIEHRLIERMIILLEKESGRIKETRTVDNSFLTDAIDFFGTYADKNHHGKEEYILFNELNKRTLQPDHKSMLQLLSADHVRGRKLVALLDNKRERLFRGEERDFDGIVSTIDELVFLYRAHISREDKNFFIPSMEYFSEEEQKEMIRYFEEFDRTLDQDKYQSLVESLEEACS